MTTLLELQDLEVRRGRSVVLRELGLSLPAGVVTGLVGPNGAGKSTLVEAVMGLVPLHRGTVLLAGAELGRGLDLAARARLGLGYLPQQPSLFRRMTVWENLRVVGGPSDAELRMLLERLGLVGLAARRASTLSGGERRRLEIGRLMAMRARVLLCDEPYAGLDPMGARTLTELLRENAEQGRAVLVTDHRVELLFGHCERLAVLLDGRIQRCGKVAEIAADELVRARYLGG